MIAMFAAVKPSTVARSARHRRDASDAARTRWIHRPCGRRAGGSARSGIRRSRIAAGPPGSPLGGATPRRGRGGGSSRRRPVPRDPRREAIGRPLGGGRAGPHPGVRATR